MLDFGLKTTIATVLAMDNSNNNNNNSGESSIDEDLLDAGNQWNNWTTYTPSILMYNAMSSVISMANQTPIFDLNQSMSGYNSTKLTSSDDVDEDAAATATFAFVVPWWRQVLWSILFGGMVIVATGGNLIVVWIVLTTKRMRTVTNYFIVNLSIADAMVSSLNVTFNSYYMLDNDWPFGEFYCKLSQFIAMLSICASVFTLMAIAIDRYVAIMRPLQPRMSKRCNLAIAAIIWLASTVISCPLMLVYKTETLTNHTRIVCYPEWPDGPMNHSMLEYIYNILIMILTYILPIVSMTVTYSRVGFELWGSKTIGEYMPRQVENVRSKRRVVKMMIVVVSIFAICWLPFHMYFIVTSCYPDVTSEPFIQELYLAIYWLAMSNSMYNPIIYCWMNSRFRYGFKMVFRWCPFVRLGAESLSRRENLTSRYSCSGSPDHNRIKRNDTQKSILYACPSSPKSHRISHCVSGALRSATLRTGHEILHRRRSSQYQQEMQQRWPGQCHSQIQGNSSTINAETTTGTSSTSTSGQLFS
ncbi:tachykinin-like peptides receptor 99D isoform X1 [Drosophila willistoni]|uniref:tachykinin-like peptides receptor 99D isoform X1 n=1 Tax=Drosophila willistoni TaxID=7260 RepID=UPI000C26CD92|nr:tachykinin-like peptides receptor 99D isoform X1 [Drosophila willistoni]